MFEMFVGAKYKFTAKRRYAYIFSSVLILASIASLIVHGGPRESIDFTGGSLLFVEFGRPVPVSAVRQAADQAHMDGAEVQMTESNHQAFIRFRTAEGDTSSPFDHFKTRLEESQGADFEVNFLSQEEVGPKIGKELERKATNAILYSLVLILGYIAFRFSRFSFGLGAVAALFHDILITLGLFSVLNIEVSLTVVAAFLTIGGYSINDTIVVFDRIRENMGLLKRMTFAEVIDKSVNQTLSRTILTAGSTLLAVIALFFLGGPVIHSFALAMLVGIVIGTYSSIFVASALALDISTWWTRRKAARQEGGKRRAVAAG
jgi:preprotein translocase SecF subunit